MDKRDLFIHSIRAANGQNDVETIGQLTIKEDGLLLVDVENNDKYLSWDDVYYAIRGTR